MHQVWHYNKGDFDGLNRKLESLNWDEIISGQNINQIAAQTVDIIIQYAKEFISYKVIKISVGDQPWITTDIKMMIKIHNRWCGVFNRTQNLIHRQIRDQYRKQGKDLIKLAKQSYYAKQIVLLSDPDCTSKCYWKIVKDLYGARRELSFSTLVDNGCIFATDQGKAEVLNNYFASQSSTLPDLPEDFCFPEPSYMTKNRLSNLELSAIEVRQALLSLKAGKASGYDGLSNGLLKQLT